MPPHFSQAGPRSRPDIFAGTTGGVSVIAAAAGTGLPAFAAAPASVAGLGVPPFGRAGGVGGDPEAELGGLRVLLVAHLLGHDSQFLERVGVLDEAAGDPAHDVVGQRFGEGDLRVAGDALRLEAHVAELAHEVFERDAYWRPSDIAVAKAFISPRIVDPSLPMSVRKISPTEPSSYLPAVM